MYRQVRARRYGPRAFGPPLPCAAAPSADPVASALRRQSLPQARPLQFPMPSMCRSSSSPPPKPERSLGPAAKQNDLHGLKQNNCIEDQPVIFDVEQVVLQLLPRVFDGCAIGILDLRPTGESGRNQMALFVIGDLFSQLRDEMRPPRSRADETHLALEDVPELRNLIDANLANDAADARRAVVAFRRPDRSFLLGVDAHRAKLRQDKRASVFTDAFLFVKDRTTRFKFDENCRHDDDWQREHRTDQSRETMHCRARERSESFLPSGSGKNQPRRADHAQRNASGDALVKRGAFFNRNASGQTQLQQFVSRKLSASLAHRHDDAIDVFTRDDLTEFVGQTDYTRIDQALAE